MKVPQLALLVAATALAGLAMPASGQAPLDPADIAAFFDGYLAERLAANHVAGAAVAVVQGGRAVFLKGYGLAEVAGHKPVDPEATMFVAGSLSKVFTWTAVMHEVERGRLELSADLDRYLDFAMPDPYPDRPLTLGDLMAHASGFEDLRYGQMAASPRPTRSLAEWVEASEPARIRAPGTATAYANYGAALAGYIVERVSGLGFDEYIEREILAPLGMAHTTFRQPTPPELAGYLAPCYYFAKGEFKTDASFRASSVLAAPAMSLRTSAGDMSRFMLAQLGRGSGKAAILRPETLRLMQERSFSNDPRANGIAHGFWELDMGGERIIGHAGSSPLSNSLLLLFPKRGLGVFIATNSAGGNDFIGNDYFPFLGEFVERLVAKGRGEGRPKATIVPPEEAASLSGAYALTMGQNGSGPEKLYSLLANVRVGFEEGRLALTLPPPYGALRFYRVGPGEYRQVDGGQGLFFREGPEGPQAAYDLAPQTLMLKKPWFELPILHLPLLAACLLCFVGSALFAPIAYSFRRARGSLPAPASARAAGLAALVASFLGFLVPVAAFASMMNVPALMLARLPLWPLVFYGSILEAALAAALAALALLAVRRPGWGLASRIRLWATAAAALGLTWFLWSWNLLGKWQGP
jgi:CubicO group peptidase (beta-lactamase class C family)